MKKLLFLVLSMAVAVSASAGVTASKIQMNSYAPSLKGTMSQQVRHADGPMIATPAPKFKAPAKADVPAGYAMVTLSAGDIWGDGSGYQMLLDADATAYGTIIPETGPLNTSGNVSASVYAEFEYKIPENADGALNTSNIVFDNSVSILVPAGTYDWCITNPTPGDRMWIAGTGGNVGGRYNDFVFQDGLTYVFEIGIYGTGDGVSVTVIEPGIALTTPENLAVNPAATTADVTWTDTDDLMWNLRYRPYVEGGGYLWNLDEADVDSQLVGWIIVDADQDGNNWGIYSGVEGQEGSYTFLSYSYDNDLGPLTPDNWLITPYVDLGGTLSFDAWGLDPSWCSEHMAVYVYLEGDLSESTTIDMSLFAPITDEMIVDGVQTTYTVDLSAYEGQKGHIAFRHFNITDMFVLAIDNVQIGATPEPWIPVNGLDATAHTIAGLTPETTYEVQVQAAGSTANSAWTDAVIFTTLAESQYMRGDVNGDGQVTIADVTTLINHVLMNDFNDGEGFNSENADCNLDGRWNISDVTALINYILSKQW